MKKNPNWIMTWLADFETWDEVDHIMQLNEVTIDPSHFPGLERTFWSMVEVNLETGRVLFYDAKGDAVKAFDLACTATEVKL